MFSTTETQKEVTELGEEMGRAKPELYPDTRKGELEWTIRGEPEDFRDWASAGRVLRSQPFANPEAAKVKGVVELGMSGTREGWLEGRVVVSGLGATRECSEATLGLGYGRHETSTEARPPHHTFLFPELHSWDNYRMGDLVVRASFSVKDKAPEDVWQALRRSDAQDGAL